MILSSIRYVRFFSRSRAVMAKRILNIIFILFLVLSFPFISFSEEIYEYERMWPVVEQQWNFLLPNNVALDSSGNVYVAESYNNRIQKFTSGGQFVTKLGSLGSGDGQLNFPVGIALDSGGNVYVADTDNHRVQKFTSNGQFVTKWGSKGSGDGQFNAPHGIAVDSSGNVYVNDLNNYRIQKFTSSGQFITKWGSPGHGDGEFNAAIGIVLDSSSNVYVADTYNHRIQKFTSGGQFITKWGSSGSDDGQFNTPYGIAVDRSGNIYVADTYNHRIQKFTSGGQFITKWGSGASNADGKFYAPRGIAFDSSGNFYVADTANHRIQKFASSGQFVTKWGSSGSGNSQFNLPWGIVLDSSDNIYVADALNHRIQRFTPDGGFVGKWGSKGSGDGQFNKPYGIALDSSGNVYVADADNHRIQRFTPSGQFITKWGSSGSGDGQFNAPSAIALDSSGNIYVADTGNHRIQKFTSSGQFVTKWGSLGSGDGQFNWPYGITLDGSGNVYVADSFNNRIQKFTSNGQFMTKWGSLGSGDGQFFYPYGITLDSSGVVYVADTRNNRFQKFTSNGQFLTKWGSAGGNAGEISYDVGIGVSSDGKVYVSETGNHRIQVFNKGTELSKNKAIIVAGSGPYKGNNLWEDIQKNANRAYHTLTYQGYTNDTIYYLSWDINIGLDLNGDGKCDVDADATNSNLQYAITEWAKDAESLVIYLIGHGGDGAFRMSETESLKAEDLASWLNELQETMQGLIIVIYEACHSGSFLSKLIPPLGKQRIVISSTASTEVAQFLEGGVSFSYYFWNEIFVGTNIYQAYVMAKDGLETYGGTERVQNPEIDDDGNGIYEGKKDGELARGECLGKCIKTAGDIPTIKSISPDQILNGQTSATITVEVMSVERIIRVWAVVYGPDFSTTPGNPITDLPYFDFTWNEQTGKYEGTYNGLTIGGTYTVTVYAMNEPTIISLPKTTKVEQVMHTLYTLTVVKPGTGSGTVTSSPAGINCGDDCGESYSKVQKVKLTAKADVNSTFTGWSGGGCSGTKTCTVTVDAAVTVTADFALKIPDISVAQPSVDFGSIKVGKKGTKTLKIMNNGTGDLVITLSGLEGTDFSIQGSSSVTIKAKKSYSLKILFTPKSAGLKTPTLRITSNDPDEPTIDIPLIGTGF